MEPDGAFKTGAESTQWQLKEIMKGCFRTLHGNPARRVDYTSVSGSEMFPLFFCATRWVEDKPVADQLIEIWDNIVNIVRYWEKLPKSKQPSSKSFLEVSKLQFFSLVTGLFKPFYHCIKLIVR